MKDKIIKAVVDEMFGWAGPSGESYNDEENKLCHPNSDSTDSNCVPINDFVNLRHERWMKTKNESTQ